jgi:hypothetical protein
LIVFVVFAAVVENFRAMDGFLQFFGPHRCDEAITAMRPCGRAVGSHVTLAVL